MSQATAGLQAHHAAAAAAFMRVMCIAKWRIRFPPLTDQIDLDMTSQTHHTCTILKGHQTIPLRA
jgi:hypothetical protein